MPEIAIEIHVYEQWGMGYECYSNRVKVKREWPRRKAALFGVVEYKQD